MTRMAVARLFVLSVSAIGVGIELLFVAGILGSLRPSSANGLIMPTPLAYGMATFTAIGAGLVAGGVLGQLVAWIAAVINTAELKDKTWLVALLILGLLSIGFVALVAYLLEAPDEAGRQQGPVGVQHDAIA
jgi:hypothetical protein